MGKKIKFYEVWNPSCYSPPQKKFDNQHDYADVVDSGGNKLKLRDIETDQVKEWSKVSKKMPFEIRAYLVKNPKERDPFKWIRIEESDTGIAWTDFFAGYVIGRNSLFSAHFKELIDENKTEHDKFEWLEIMVESYRARRPYYLIHFLYETLEETIDVERTQFSYKTNKRWDIMMPTFIGEAVKKYSILPMFERSKNFASFWQVQGRLHVSENLKRIIEDAGMTNIKFKEVSVS